jgi:hypothetical protein
MIPKSGNRFSEKIMLNQKARAQLRFDLMQLRSSGMIPKRGNRFSGMVMLKR